MDTLEVEETLSYNSSDIELKLGFPLRKPGSGRELSIQAGDLT
jgi:hypothetical protein